MSFVDFLLKAISLSFISLRLYLKYIVDFQGRGRFRFIFNQNTDVTKSKQDAARFLGVSYSEFNSLYKRYQLEDFFNNVESI